MAAAAVALPPVVDAQPARKKVRMAAGTKSGGAPSFADQICMVDENVDRRALVPVTKGEFRVDTTESFDKTPQGNAWKPFKNGRGVNIKVWVPEERATGDFLEAMRSVGPGLLTTLKGYAAGLPTAKRRNAFLKKLDKDGFLVINPSKIKFDSSGACKGFEDPAYVRLGFEWWMEDPHKGRLDSTFRVQDGLGGNVTQVLTEGTGVAVDSAPLVFRDVAEDGSTATTEVDGFAPFVRFNKDSCSFIHGCITGHQTYQGATVRLSLKDLNLYFAKAIITDHQGYITVNLKMQPAFVSDAWPDRVLKSSITGVLHAEDENPARSGFM